MNSIAVAKKGKNGDITSDKPLSATATKETNSDGIMIDDIEMEEQATPFPSNAAKLMINYPHRRSLTQLEGHDVRGDVKIDMLIILLQLAHLDHNGIIFNLRKLGISLTK